MTPAFTRRRFLAIAGAACVAAPAPANANANANANAETVRWRGFALGAEAEIILRGPRADAARALDAARRALTTAEALFSLYRDDSALSRLNREGAIAPPPQFADLLRIADRLHLATEGRFDPTVQPLWRALAKGGDADAARRLIGWRRVRLGTPTTLGAGQALTLNGVAQGYATDMVTDALAAEGFADVLVNIGEFRAGDGDWRVGVEDPEEGLVRTATLRSRAIATSSPAATRVGGAPHIFGPEGDAPIWSTVSVEADTAAMADGLSTALCLAGEADAIRIARSLPGVRRLTLVAKGGDMRSIRI